ncbi:MAG TPA: SpoIIE family protein phosphatase [Pirellulales bacterium]|nr:SpoIIE family protein phosphatase [Pirellulales bacterium]
MARSIPSYLRLYNEARPAAGRLADFWPGLDKLCRAFERATGWPLQCQPDPASPGDHTTLLWSAPAVSDGLDAEQLRVGVATAAGAAPTHAPADLAATVDLASTIGQLMSDLAHARQALWKREAELAAGVPLPLYTDEKHLAGRLKSSLQAAAQAAHADAAALYLLDETTTYLKLRSVWGLPQERFLLPPRELALAAADLEALLGHAIVLDDAKAQATFNLPEPTAAAVCVPVASATAPLGTLWVFGNRPRSHTDHEVNMVEIVAGRIATELEREMLVAAGAEAGRAKRQLAAAERWQESHQPHTSPLSDLWQIAGWAQSAGDLSSEFYDWLVRPDNSLAIVLGSVRQQHIAAALAASELRGMVRAHAHHTGDPAEILVQVRESLAMGSPANEESALFVAVAEGSQPVVRLATAGGAQIWKITTAGVSSLASAGPPLGADSQVSPRTIELRVQPGDILVAVSEGAARTLAGGQERATDELLSALFAHREQPAKVLVEIINDRLTALAGESTLADCAAVLVKRRS